MRHRHRDRVRRGTTGRGNATPVTVTSSSAVIRVPGTVTMSGAARVASNKTIIGAGAKPGISGGRLDLVGVHNVTIQNMRLTNWAGDEGQIKITSGTTRCGSTTTTCPTVTTS